MQPLVAAILIGVPLAWLVGFAAYVYVDAPKRGMNRRKWTAIAFFVPLFGFFAYIFERDERDYDPEEDPYAGGTESREAGFAVHESRRGEKPLGPAGTEVDSDDDEWNDPASVDVDEVAGEGNGRDSASRDRR
ncbi:PLD nuclease N-terminal domain-containing protein [Halorubrum sp. DTA46]|uniref:PLD nuclease N-terminal domain-containing protein n=1 Tax=Halorubrum sp. DTA46 TaxID=3402162 RepID=UPI003AAD8A96